MSDCQELSTAIVKSGMSRQISESFKTIIDNKTIFPVIYTERVNDAGLDCFIIDCLSVEKNPLTLRSNKYTFQMIVEYRVDPSVGKARERESSVGFKLLEVLQTIRIPGYFRDDEGQPITKDTITKGSDLSYKIVDNTLQFYVTYDVSAFVWQDKLYMNNVLIRMGKSQRV